MIIEKNKISCIVCSGMTAAENYPFLYNPETEFSAQSKRIILAFNNYNYLTEGKICKEVYAEINKFQSYYYGFNDVGVVNGVSPESLGSSFKRYFCNQSNKLAPKALESHFENPNFPLYGFDSSNIIITDLPIQNELLESPEIPIYVSENYQLAIISLGGVINNTNFVSETELDANNILSIRKRAASVLTARAMAQLANIEESLEPTETFPYIFKYHCSNFNCTMQNYASIKNVVNFGIRKYKNPFGFCTKCDKTIKNNIISLRYK